MNKQTFIKIATVIFAIVGVVHIYRAINDLPFVVAGWIVPVSLSWFAGLLALVLAYSGYRYWKK
jgi:hypothetical protein